MDDHKFKISSWVFLAEEQRSLSFPLCWDSTDQYALRLRKRDDSEGAKQTTLVMTRLRT